MIETIQETGQKGIARAGGVLMYIFRDHRDHLLHAVFLNETAGSIQLYHHFLEKFTQHPAASSGVFVPVIFSASFWFGV